MQKQHTAQHFLLYITNKKRATTTANSREHRRETPAIRSSLAQQIQIKQSEKQQQYQQQHPQQQWARQMKTRQEFADKLNAHY